MNTTERKDLAQWAVGRALKLGADQAAVSVSWTREISVDHRDGKLETLTEATQNSLGIELYAHQKYSSHSTNDLRKDSLEKFIEAAVKSTGYLTKDEFRALPDPKLYPGKNLQDLRLNDPTYEAVETPDRVKMAGAIEKVAVAQSDQIISSTASYADVHSKFVRVHSNGFEGESEKTTFSMGAEVTVRDKEGGRPEDYAWSTVRFRNELPDTETLGKEAAQRALRKVGQKKIASGRYEMLVENRTAGRLFAMMQGPLGGRALQQKNSYLDGMLGKQIASPILTVIDDPFLEKGLGSRHFDSEGLGAKRRLVVEKGILRSYYIDNYYGKKLGMEPSSGSPTNILLEYGSRSLDEMVKQVKRGILVSGFIGGNSNGATGDFSFGIVGLLVENGQIVHPVNEMNISGNGKEFWNQLVEVGSDPYPYSSMRLPSLRFDGVSFSGL